MAKILVERPRLGGGMKFQRNAERAWQRVPVDERPRHEAIKTCWRHSKVALKSLNENLAPLRRFLRKQLGRPWDDVRSEIAERVDRSSAVQLHIWQHLAWEVITDPRRVAERIALAQRVRLRQQFYVDPCTGRLCEIHSPMTKRREEALRREAQFLRCVDGQFYRRIGGVWYEIELGRLPDDGRPVWDAVMRRPTSQIPRSELFRAYGGRRYAARKRQLGSQEVRRLLQALEKQLNRRR